MRSAPISSLRLMHDDPGSAFFFFGSFRPVELANFNVMNVFLEDGGVVEMIGPRWGMWWGSTHGRDYAEYDRRCDEWISAIVAIYHLTEGVALTVIKEHWVEALRSNVEEAVLGFNDDRFTIVTTPPNDVNDAIHRAIRAAPTLLENEHLKQAAREALKAGRDHSDDGLLSAFRALECLRRHYDPDDSAGGKKKAWEKLRSDLVPDLEPYEVLLKAAKAARHGDRPATAAEEHDLNAARPRRGELVTYSAVLVRRVLERELSDPGTQPA